MSESGGYFSKEVCVAECPDPNEMNFGRQSGPITVTVTGNREDLHNWFGKLYPWLYNQSANVDFHYDMESLTFKVYPFAVND